MMAMMMEMALEIFRQIFQTGGMVILGLILLQVCLQ